jgi:hypothetical protein
LRDAVRDIRGVARAYQLHIDTQFLENIEQMLEHDYFELMRTVSQIKIRISEGNRDLPRDLGLNPAEPDLRNKFFALFTRVIRELEQASGTRLDTFKLHERFLRPGSARLKQPHAPLPIAR